MSGAAHNLDQEFWQPPQQISASAAVNVGADVCPRCNSEFVIGSRFCHVCGGERDPQPALSGSGLSQYLDFHFLRESLGLTVGALVAFLVGVVCVAAAVATGLLYTASTVLDWQAVQLWRIEWLLGGTTAFLAGILLKRNS